jgi:hypothetical protein
MRSAGLMIYPFMGLFSKFRFGMFVALIRSLCKETVISIFILSVSSSASIILPCARLRIISFPVSEAIIF